MSSKTIFLITGSNRGLGLTLTEKLVSRPNTIVVAMMRPTSSDEKLKQLKTSEGSAVHIVANTITAAELQKAHPDVTHIDTAIANAGTATAESFLPILEQKDDIINRDFTVNVLGSIHLFQEFWQLLKLSSQPKFFVMSSVVGSIEIGEDMPPSYAYGMSKAALNFFSRKLHFEHKDLISVSLHPGWVKTDMGQAFADVVHAPEPPTTLEESVSGMLNNVILPATREQSSGKFFDFRGNVVPW